MNTLQVFFCNKDDKALKNNSFKTSYSKSISRLPGGKRLCGKQLIYNSKNNLRII